MSDVEGMVGTYVRTQRVGLKGGTGNWKLEMRKWEMRQYFIRPHVEQALPFDRDSSPAP